MLVCACTSAFGSDGDRIPRSGGPGDYHVGTQLGTQPPSREHHAHEFASIPPWTSREVASDHHQDDSLPEAVQTEGFEPLATMGLGHDGSIGTNERVVSVETVSEGIGHVVSGRPVGMVSVYRSPGTGDIADIAWELCVGSSFRQPFLSMGKASSRKRIADISATAMSPPPGRFRTACGSFPGLT